MWLYYSAGKCKSKLLFYGFRCKNIYCIKIKIRAAWSLCFGSMWNDSEEHEGGFWVAGRVLFLGLDAVCMSVFTFWKVTELCTYSYVPLCSRSFFNKKVFPEWTGFWEGQTQITYETLMCCVTIMHLWNCN